MQLGASASLISAIGQDPLGDEILKVAEDKGVNTQFVTRARIGLPTGTVLVTVDANGNATYELVQPVAWNEIRVLPEALDAVAQALAFNFGSLAGRSPYNLDQLDRLQAIEGPMKYFDVNLRPPFADPELVVHIAKRADVIKLTNSRSLSRHSRRALFRAALRAIILPPVLGARTSFKYSSPRRLCDKNLTFTPSEAKR